MGKEAREGVQACLSRSPSGGETSQGEGEGEGRQSLRP